MSRSAVPSHAQVEMLLESLEERHWLATGHARTSNARDRTRAAWQEVAAKLNSDGSGCIKSWQQWAKIFQPGPSSNLNPNVPDNIPEAPDAMDLSQTIQDVMDVNDDLQTPESESILQSHMEILLPVEASTTTTAALLQTETSTHTLPDVQQGSSSIRPNADSPPEVAHRSNAPIAFSSPRRRRLVTARRRLIQRSPPSQRRSHMASLTERFIAIEERRLENEKLLIDNQQKMLDIFKNISESWSRQTQALQDLCVSMRRGSSMSGA